MLIPNNAEMLNSSCQDQDSQKVLRCKEDKDLKVVILVVAVEASEVVQVASVEVQVDSEEALEVEVVASAVEASEAVASEEDPVDSVVVPAVDSEEVAEVETDTEPEYN